MSEIFKCKSMVCFFVFVIVLTLFSYNPENEMKENGSNYNIVENENL